MVQVAAPGEVSITGLSFSSTDVPAAATPPRSSGLVIPCSLRWARNRTTPPNDRFRSSAMRYDIGCKADRVEGGLNLIQRRLQSQSTARHPGQPNLPLQSTSKCNTTTLHTRSPESPPNLTLGMQKRSVLIIRTVVSVLTSFQSSEGFHTFKNQSTWFLSI